jgi:hypothetical protein
VRPASSSDDHVDADVIDLIANALPPEIRADYYRELRHCRSLPENDEMLRILRVMQYMTLLTVEVPGKIAGERGGMEALFKTSIETLRHALESTIAWQKELDGRLRELPETVVRDLSPEAIAANINKSLRQQFVVSTIPQTGQALAAVAAELQRTTKEFREKARMLGDSYQGAAEDARRAVNRIESAVSQAAASAARAVQELTGTFRKEYRWSILALSGLALLIGIVIGMLFQRWIDTPH